jgi:hypothetical protein
MKRMVMIALTLGASGALIAACSSGNQHLRAEKSTTTTFNSQASAPTTTTTTIPVTTTTAAPTTTVPPTATTIDPAAVIHAWLSTNEGTFQTLQNDLDTINSGGNSGDSTEILTGCQRLNTDAATAQKIPPVPNSQIQGQWEASLSDFGTAAQDCINGLENGDVNLASQYKTYINKGIAEQSKLVKEIEALG